MFKYIIMAGGYYQQFKDHKALSVVNGEPLVARTIRLLKENGINENIFISSNDDRFKEYGYVIKHENSYRPSAHMNTF